MFVSRREVYDLIHAALGEIVIFRWFSSSVCCAVDKIKVQVERVSFHREPYLTATQVYELYKNPRTASFDIEKICDHCGNQTYPLNIQFITLLLHIQIKKY